MSRKLLGAVAIAVIVGLSYATLRFDARALGQAALAQASEASGVRLEADDFSFGLFSGLTLDGVTAESESPYRFRLKMARLVFQHEFGPILSGTLAVRRVLVDSLEVELVARSDARSSATTSAVSNDSVTIPAGLALAVAEVAIRDGSITLLDGDGTRTLALSGLDLTLSELALDPAGGSLFQAASGRGALEIREVELATTTATDARGRAHMANGRFNVEEFGFATPEGRFVGRLEIDWTETPFRYATTVASDPIDVNVLTGAGTVGGFGTGALEFSGTGRGAETRDFVGKGSVRLREGRLPGGPLLTGIEQTIGRSGIADSPYAETESRFSVRDDRVFIEPTAFVSDDVRVDLGGTVELAGPLHLELVVATPREGLGIPGVPSGVLDALTDERGWVAVPMVIEGTSEAPRTHVDGAALRRQARTAAGRSATQKLGDFLKKRF